jgi:hypothetical protein
VSEPGFCYNQRVTARISLLGARCFYTAAGAAFQTCNQPSPCLGPNTPIGPVKPDRILGSEQELIQSVVSGKALLLFLSALISFARFSRISSVPGGSPAFSIDLKTA